MTDSRITRIVDQLADLTDEEMRNLVETINIKRMEKKKEKQEAAVREFKSLFQKLDELDVDVLCYDADGAEIILHPNDVFFQSW